MRATGSGLKSGSTTCVCAAPRVAWRLTPAEQLALLRVAVLVRGRWIAKSNLVRARARAAAARSQSRIAHARACRPAQIYDNNKTLCAARDLVLCKFALEKGARARVARSAMRANSSTCCCLMICATCRRRRAVRRRSPSRAVARRRIRARRPTEPTNRPTCWSNGKRINDASERACGRGAPAGRPSSSDVRACGGAAPGARRPAASTCRGAPSTPETRALALWRCQGPPR